MGTARGPFAALRDERASTRPFRRGNGVERRAGGGLDPAPGRAPRVTDYDPLRGDGAENVPVVPDVNRSQTLRPAAYAVIWFCVAVGVLSFSHYLAPRIAEWIVGG